MAYSVPASVVPTAGNDMRDTIRRLLSARRIGCHTRYFREANGPHMGAGWLTWQIL